MIEGKMDDESVLMEEVIRREPSESILEWMKEPKSVDVPQPAIHMDIVKREGLLPPSLPPTQTSLPTSVAKSSDFKQAVEMLLQLYRLFGGGVRNEELSNFVDCYGETVVRGVADPIYQITGAFVQADHFSCPVCLGVLTEPVTIHCGHSYCRRCLEEEEAGGWCRRCNYNLVPSDISGTRCNVLLGSLVEKWWSRDLKAGEARSDANAVLNHQNNFATSTPDQLLISLFKYKEAIDLVFDDHQSLGNRAATLLSLGRHEESLADAEGAIRACPFWSQGYFQKAVALGSIGRYDDSFINLTMALFLLKTTKGPSGWRLKPIKAEMVRVLHKIFLQLVGESGVTHGVRRHSLDHLTIGPYPNPRKAAMRRERMSRYALATSDLSESENNSSGDEGESKGGMPISKIPRHEIQRERARLMNQSLPSSSSTSFEGQLGRVSRLFDRALQEISRLQTEIMDFRERMQMNFEIERPFVGEEGICPQLLRPVDSSLITINDFECTLCYRLLHQPVTTTCGHTYCRTCLERCLDHSPLCPLCKTSLNSYLAQRRLSVTNFVDVAMARFFPKERQDRLNQYEEEVAEVGCQNPEIPIFVCTMAFPTVPCPLHVFEPRYRLMIRRTMEAGTRRFGMCCYQQDGENNYGVYGTLLEIKNVQYFSDGRSVVDTVGARRFKVLKKSMKDGYNTASVEFIQDRPVDETEWQRIKEIRDRVHLEATEWLKTIDQVLRQRIYTHFGPMPDPEMEGSTSENPDGPPWIWWLLAILPLDPKAQLAILSMNSLLKRLESILKVVRYARSSQN